MDRQRPFCRFRTPHTFRPRLAWPLTAASLALLLLGGCGPGFQKTPAYSDITPSYEPAPPRDQVARKPAAAPLEPAKSLPAGTDARLADLASQQEALRDRLQRLEGRQEETQYALRQQPGEAQLESLSQRVSALERSQQALLERLAQLEATRAPASRPAAESGSPEAAAAPKNEAPRPAPKPTGDPFQEGMAQYKKKSYDAAQQQFSRYLSDHPQGPKATEARFYLADSHYQQRHLDEAIVEFNRVVEAAPKSPLAPAALLRQAYAFKAQGKTKVHNLVLEKIISDYPNSQEAAQAGKLLGAAKKSPEKKKGK